MDKHTRSRIAPSDKAARAAPRVATDYDSVEGSQMMSGTQALVRLPLEQRRRDVKAGLNTGGFISGYRGSPLGTYDQELWRAGKQLKAANVRFQPGLNEDLAATAVWGTQFVNLYPGAEVDGVFGIWYGKSPGVDRSGDAFQHANTSGTSATGGVVALVGDDHASKSSSRAGQSDFQLKAAGMPVLYPADVQEILDFGLHAIAMSRYSGCWVSLKLVTDVVEVTSSIDVSEDRLDITHSPLPTDPPGGLHIRRNESPLEMEARLYDHKIPAVIAYARANGLNRILLKPGTPRLGIVSAGKNWGDLMSAFRMLGLDEEALQASGVRLLKLGMTWPVDPEIVHEFSRGLDTILVVEEKRPFIEEQIKFVLFDAQPGTRLRVIGKAQPVGKAMPGQLPVSGELTPHLVANSIAALLGLPPSSISALSAAPSGPVRLPNFCSGCPHNSSTVVPEGSRAMAGIGCHGMAMWIRADSTGTVTHMGAEGMFWVGQSHFTSEKHVFVNIGDGTFFHSGSLALRQAVAAKVRMTYKVLFNGYVSMTGGQPHDSEVSVARVIDVARAEGVEQVVVVADDVARYDDVVLPSGVKVFPRTQLDAVQRRLREFEGVSVLIYDQACATERRRERKKAPELDVAKRTFINAEVCEGCGDCGTKSNCMSVEPLETEFGRKRRINQSSCNKDFSCVEGFCPSFVTVHGGRLKKPIRVKSSSGSSKPLPDPTLPMILADYNIMLAGVGGTGTVTVGTILGHAAHFDGLRVSVLDLTGMAQKYGAVMSHVRISRGISIQTARLGIGEADTVIGCDLLVAAGQESLSKMSPERSFAVLNTASSPTWDFPRTPDWNPQTDALIDRVRERTSGNFGVLDATRIATALMGDAIAVNMFLLGYAWQSGRIPLTLNAINHAIERNGVELEFNRESFGWGRQAAVDLGALEELISPKTTAWVVEMKARQLQRPDDIIADRARRLENYQNAAYSRRYVERMKRLADKDAEIGAQGRLIRAAARYHYKLLADKDEFEVARLYSASEFMQQLQTQFEGDYKLHFHLGAWPFASRDSAGNLRKREVGPWLLRAMCLLQKLRWTRNTWLDPFRHTPERRMAQDLLASYEQDLDLVLEHGSSVNAGIAVDLLALPERIRGYGHVRAAHVERLTAERLRLQGALTGAADRRVAA